MKIDGTVMDKLRDHSVGRDILDPGDAWLAYQTIERLQSELATERERCAKIAEADAANAQEQIERNNEYMERTGSIDHVPNDLCRHRKHHAEQIAVAIRRPD